MTHTKIDHKFTFDQLSYDAKPNVQTYVKLLFFFNKKDGVSDEHFRRHYETVHADLTVAAKGFEAFNIQRYTQMHQSPDYKEKVKGLGVELLDFDACSEMWVKSWDDWVDFASSSEFAEALAPDGKLFMGGSTLKVFAGRENIIFGKTLDAEGKDGITFD